MLERSPSPSFNTCKGLIGAEVDIALEIHAKLSKGAPDHVIRTVTENCRMLRFKTHGFEEE